MLTRVKLFALLLLMLAALATTSLLLAQSSSGFDLSWHVLGSGGAAESASYRLQGTAGQALTGPAAASSANYALRSGYWVFGHETPLYLPVVAGG